MRHSTCVKICVRSRVRVNSSGTRPQLSSSASACCASSVPSTFGSSQSPGKQTRLGPLAHGVLPAALKKEDRLFFDAAGLFCLLDGERSPRAALFCKADCPQRTGIALRRTVWDAYTGSQFHQCLRQLAPLSGICSVNRRSAVSYAFLTAGRVTGAVSCVTRESTRSTFPSTAGSGTSKQMDATAPAV